MPGRAEPRTNLAIAMDRSGKFAEAFRTTNSALDLKVFNIPAFKVIARIQVRETASMRRWHAISGKFRSMYLLRYGGIG
jgi:hypothetical protein